jgi:1-acyl-sn-glycerol-3-phosphate acyltransferase
LEGGPRKLHSVSFVPGPGEPAPSVRSRRAPALRLVHSAPSLDPVLMRRSPALIRRAFPALAAITDRYFRAEVEGVEHLTDRGSMVVSTHNGGVSAPDMYCLLVAFWRRFGLETPGYGLMHEAAFHIPVLGSFLDGLGAIPAGRKNAEKVLDAGFPLLVCPGGDMDALKPFSKRHTICFGKRKGFIRLAIEKQVPIVPAVSVGAHETLFVLNDGRSTAGRTGLSKFFRVKSLPLVLSFPFGLTPAGIFSIPLPSKIKVRILPRIELGEPSWASKNDEVVDRCFEHVRRTMQRALDDLASRRKRIFFG